MAYFEYNPARLSIRKLQEEIKSSNARVHSAGILSSSSAPSPLGGYLHWDIRWAKVKWYMKIYTVWKEIKGTDKILFLKLWLRGTSLRRKPSREGLGMIWWRETWKLLRGPWLQRSHGGRSNPGVLVCSGDSLCGRSLGREEKRVGR